MSVTLNLKCLIGLACLFLFVSSAQCDDTQTPGLFVVLVGGLDSDPTADQIAGTARRGTGNSGLFQLANDLRQQSNDKLSVRAEYFNWNGTAAGKIHQETPPLSEGIADRIRQVHATRPRDKFAIVGNSWGGHTTWEVAQVLAEDKTVPLELAIFLDPSSAGRYDKGQPHSISKNVRDTAIYATRNALAWKKWKDDPRSEFIDLGDPARGFLKKPGPAYDSLFDVKAHIAAEWDEAIHKDITTRLLKLVR